MFRRSGVFSGTQREERIAEHAQSNTVIFWKFWGTDLVVEVKYSLVSRRSIQMPQESRNPLWLHEETLLDFWVPVPSFECSHHFLPGGRLIATPADNFLWGKNVRKGHKGVPEESCPRIELVMVHSRLALEVSVSLPDDNCWVSWGEIPLVLASSN